MNTEQWDGIVLVLKRIEALREAVVQIADSANNSDAIAHWLDEKFVEAIQGSKLEFSSAPGSMTYDPSDSCRERLVERRKRALVSRPVEIAAPRDAAYLESMKKMVELLKANWLSARELADKLNVSHQSPYNRIKRLEELGYIIESRIDETLFRPMKRYHIAKGDIDLLEKGL